MTRFVFQSLESRYKFYEMVDGAHDDIVYISRRAMMRRIVKWLAAGDTIDVSLVSKMGCSTFSLPYNHSDIITHDRGLCTYDTCMDLVTKFFIDEVESAINNL